MDISLLFNQDENPFLTDIAKSGTDLKTGTDLENAIEMSIFTNRRANAADALPYPNMDPQGWWGDTYSAIPGDLIGSRLWELTRNVQSNQTALTAKDMVTEALAWLTADGVVTAFTVSASFISTGILGIVVSLSKPTGQQVYKYSYVWGQL